MMENNIRCQLFPYLIVLLSASIEFYSSANVQVPINFISGGRDSIYCIDTFDFIHPMFFQNATLTFGTPFVTSGPIHSAYFRLALGRAQTFLALMLDQSIILIEEETNREITTFEKDGLTDLISIKTGRFPDNFYLLFNTTPPEVKRYKMSKNVFYPAMDLPPDLQIVKFYPIISQIICCGADGRIVQRNGPGQYSDFTYSHSEEITFIEMNSDQDLLFTGDAGGTIIVGNGSIDDGFQKIGEYHEHNCSIVSIIPVGSFLISSDQCGILVQFDIENNIILDRRPHPGTSPENPVYLTQYLNDGFGASAKKGDQTVHYYIVNDKKNQSIEKKEEEKAQAKIVAVGILRQVCKRIVMIPCLRLFLKLFMPWLVWLEDLYYYSYHRYDYNEGVTIFLVEMYFINEEKVSPVLVYAFEKNYISKHLKFNTTNYKDYYSIRNLPKQETFDMYFLEYTKSLYIESFLQQLGFFLFVKIIFEGLKRCVKDPQRILSLSEFEGNTLFWFFLLNFMADNALYISFACSAQIRTAFSFNFMDKVNLISSVLCFFVLISFTFGFFMLTLTFFPEKRISEAALYQVQARRKGFVTECMIFGVRSIVSGMIHGFILDNSELQVILLMSLSFIIIFWVCLYKKQFSYQVCFWFTFFYHLGFAVFNMSVLLEMKRIPIIDIKMSDFQFFLLCALLLIVLLRFIGQIVIFLKERLAFHQKVTKFLEKIGLKKSNKIAPAPTKQSPDPPSNTGQKGFYIFSVKKQNQKLQRSSQNKKNNQKYNRKKEFKEKQKNGKKTERKIKNRQIKIMDYD